jgi:hypothetical protein
MNCSGNRLNPDAFLTLFYICCFVMKRGTFRNLSEEIILFRHTARWIEPKSSSVWYFLPTLELIVQRIDYKFRKNLMMKDGLIINQLDALISQIHFGRKIYIFRTVLLSIIKSFSLYMQQCYMSYRFSDI